MSVRWELSLLKTPSGLFGALLMLPDCGHGDSHPAGIECPLATCYRLTTTDFTNRDSGAIITAKANEPLVYAERSEPVDPADSGWQFSSLPLGGEDLADTQIWLVRAILTREPSLQGLIDLPSGTILHRSVAGKEWQVAPS